VKVDASEYLGVIGGAHGIDLHNTIADPLSPLSQNVDHVIGRAAARPR